MENKKILNIAFPRSGQYMLAKCLAMYFRGEFKYCEFYNHCSLTPCISNETNFQKQHDFSLELPDGPGKNYIILYRHPLSLTTG